ncbi:hypothetical protein [Streptacidiphilus cavernicola]|uniref:Uncharacterized protein n=1 Tax=Streptacidiphilus cavernicola TaxID=3342716 RepID=A0ABV6VY68_9ACTN
MNIGMVLDRLTEYADGIDTAKPEGQLIKDEAQGIVAGVDDGSLTPDWFGNAVDALNTIARLSGHPQFS